MTKMLASINSLAEAAIALTEYVDIIDLKDPASGSLGRLDLQTVEQIVAFVKGVCPISATIGDLPMQPELILTAAKDMASTGVDFVKIGIETNQNGIDVIEELISLAKNCSLIAVLFADQRPDLAILDNLKLAGFAGIMLDTFDKKIGSLTAILAKAEIADFVNQVKSRDLLCGLAGSLGVEDIPDLLQLKSDYLGFRGALCLHGRRINHLNRASLQHVKQAMVMS